MSLGFSLWVKKIDRYRENKTEEWQGKQTLLGVQINKKLFLGALVFGLILFPRFHLSP